MKLQFSRCWVSNWAIFLFRDELKLIKYFFTTLLFYRRSSFVVKCLNRTTELWENEQRRKFGQSPIFLWRNLGKKFTFTEHEKSDTMKLLCDASWWCCSIEIGKSSITIVFHCRRSIFVEIGQGKNLILSSRIHHILLLFEWHCHFTMPCHLISSLSLPCGTLFKWKWKKRKQQTDDD